MAPRIPALPTEGRDPKTAELLDSFKGFNGTELSYLCRAPYEWGQHVAIGLAAGLTHEEIARVAGGPDASGWSDADALLLRTTDELLADSCIGDDTWAALVDQWDEQQLIELCMVVGQYHLVP
jgi:alkylhydroperoxidase family enzyme